MKYIIFLYVLAFCAPACCMETKETEKNEIKQNDTICIVKSASESNINTKELKRKDTPAIDRLKVEKQKKYKNRESFLEENKKSNNARLGNLWYCILCYCSSCSHHDPEA